MQRLIPIPNKSGLAKENITVADALKAAGYATGLFGKWHLGGRDGFSPTEQGFDVFYDPKGENPNASKPERFSWKRGAPFGELVFDEKNNSAASPGGEPNGAAAN